MKIYEKTLKIGFGIKQAFLCQSVKINCLYFTYRDTKLLVKYKEGMFYLIFFIKFDKTHL